MIWGMLEKKPVCAFHGWAGNSRGSNARQMTRSIPFMDRSPSLDPRQVIEEEDVRLYTSGLFAVGGFL